MNDFRADQVKEAVKKYYTEYGLREWERLTRHPYRRLEFDTTVYFLKQYLPPKGLVLDAGGGPGRYTIELAKMGYEVILLDLTPKLLDIAREQITKAEVGNKVKEILQGTIDDFSIFDDNMNPSVFRAGFLILARIDGALFTETNGNEPVAFNAFLDQKRLYRTGAALTKSDVGFP